MPILESLNCSANIIRVLPLLETLSHDHRQLVQAEQLELEDCLLRVEAVARQIPNTQTRKLARLYDVQILLMKEQRMIEQKSYEDTKRDLQIAELELQLAKSAAKAAEKDMEITRMKAEAQLRATTTQLLAEQSKLHMRGLIELFEQQFEDDEEFKREKQRELQRLEDEHRKVHGAIPKANRPHVTRKAKWRIALGVANFADVAQNIVQECQVHPEEVATQINALLGKLNNLAHHPLRDVLDPSSATCLVINHHVIGDLPSKLLRCIALKCNIDVIII